MSMAARWRRIWWVTVSIDTSRAWLRDRGQLRPVREGFLEVHAALLLAGLRLLVLGEAQVHRAASPLEAPLRRARYVFFGSPAVNIS